MTVVSTTPSRAFAGFDREALSRLAAIAAATIFILAGLAIVALGSAFPLALSVVDGRNLPVSAADLALAQRIEPFWPAIVAVGVANVVGAFAVLDRRAIGKAIAIVVAGTSAALAVVADVALALNGEPAIVLGAIGGIYAATLLGTILVERRPRAA